MNNKTTTIKLSFVCISYISFIFFCTKFLIAEVFYTQARVYFEESKLQTSLNFVNYAINFNANEPAYYRQRAAIYLVAASAQAQEEKTRYWFKTKALKDLNTALNLNTINLATIRNNLPYVMYLAYKDLNIKVLTPSNTDQEFLDFAIKYLAAIKHYSPNDVGIYLAIAPYEKEFELTKEYNETLEIIKFLRQDLLQWYYQP